MTNTSMARVLHTPKACAKTIKKMPREVQDDFAFALQEALMGSKSVHAVPMKGFPGAMVMEVRSDHDGNTYRLVYTPKLPGGVYVLHAFQKKSPHGIATAKSDIDLIEKRLKDAKALSKV
jgi:phage-related protein